MGGQSRVEKRVLEPGRVRRIRGGFSWIDRRFVRDRWVERLCCEEIALYLFLVAVADKDGLSYYSEARIAGTLKISREEVAGARGRLVELGLVAFESPLYQVLELRALDRPW